MPRPLILVCTNIILNTELSTLFKLEEVKTLHFLLFVWTDNIFI